MQPKNRAARRQIQRGTVVDQSNGWLAYWPADDANGMGTCANGTAKYYTRNGIKACVEVEDNGRARMALWGPERDLTLDEIYYARATLCPEVEFLALIMAKVPDVNWMLCFQQVGMDASTGGLIVPGRW